MGNIYFVLPARIERTSAVPKTAVLSVELRELSTYFITIREPSPGTKWI